MTVKTTATLAHSRDEYLWQVSLKSFHHQVRRYRVTRNKCERTTHGRTDGRTTQKHKPGATYSWQRRLQTY